MSTISGEATELISSDERRVNETTLADQHEADVASLASGAFVVVWRSDESGGDIFMRHFAADGHALSAEVQVNTFSSSAQTAPVVQELASGGYVVAWSSADQDGSGTGVYLQRYDASGNRDGSETRVNTTTVDNQQGPNIAQLTDGGYVVTWNSRSQDTSGWGVYGQRFDAQGNRVANEFKVNTVTYSDQHSAVPVGLAGGGFVVVWQSDLQDGSGNGVFAQRYSADGSVAGAEERINSVVYENQGQPAAAATSDGGYLVAWASALQDGSGYGIYLQRYGATGEAIGHETRVNTTIAGNQWFPAIAVLSDGGYVVSWTSLGQDGSASGIYAQRFDAANVKIGPEILVNSETAQSQEGSDVTAAPNAGFVVSWQSLAQDGSGWGVYSKAFARPNVAPEAVSATALVGTTLEDQWTQSVVSAIFGSNFLDADQDSLAGVVITANAATSAEGTWHYSVTGVDTWIAISTNVAEDAALVLSAGAHLRFIPAANFNGSAPALTAHLIDSSAGPVTTGDLLNLIARTTGGLTPYSSGSVVVSQVFTPVNDAPEGAVTISGSAVQGQVLTVANTLIDVDGLGDFSYQWKADGSDIVGATSASLTLGQGEVGKSITVVASYTDGDGTSESKSSDPAATEYTVTFDNIPSTGSFGGQYVYHSLITEAGLIFDNPARSDATEFFEIVPTSSYYYHRPGVIALWTEPVIISAASGHLFSARSIEIDSINEQGPAVVTFTGLLANGASVTRTFTTDMNRGLQTVPLEGLDDLQSLTLTYQHNGTNIQIDNFSFSTTAVANVNDAPTGSVTITGTLKQGQTLTASNTLDDADGMGTISYQWQADGSDIVDATSQSLTLSSAQVGKAITVVASYTDGGGTIQSVPSIASPLVVGNAAPQVISPTAFLYTTLEDHWTGGRVDTYVGNTFSDADDDRFAGIAITANQTSAVQGGWAYTPDSTSHIWFAVPSDLSETNALLLAAEAQLRFVPALNFNGPAPALTAHLVDNSAGWPTTGATVNLAAAGTGGLTPYSSGTVAISQVFTPVNDAPQGAVTISGTAVQGQVLTVANTLSDVDGLGDISYQWKADGTDISGATNASLTLGQEHVGTRIQVSASYNDSGGTTEVQLSDLSAPVANVNDVPTGAVLITGTAAKGATLTASNTLGDIDGLGAIAYQWKADGADIAGAGGSTLLLEQAHVGKVITVVASYTDGGGTLETKASNATPAVAQSGATAGSGSTDGNDTLVGSLSGTTLSGGRGDDTYVVSVGGITVSELTGAGLDQVISSVSFALSANVENLTLTGSSRVNATGNVLDNVLVGNGNGNTITGGMGADTLTGGLGTDRFVYGAIAESPRSLGAWDVITDLTNSDTDRIDLSALDSNPARGGRQAFIFIGTADFGSNATGQLRFDSNSHMLLGSTNTDATAEFAIELLGVDVLNAWQLIL